MAGERSRERGQGVRRAEDLVGYNRRVFERFERSAVRRGWAAAVKNHGTGHLSVKNTLVHVLNVHEAWLVAIAQEKWSVFDAPGRRPDAVRSWKELRAYRERVWAGEDALLKCLTETSLRRRVRAPWMPGRYTLADAVLQVTLEQAHHLGEVIAIYWQADRQPPAMTWIENMRPRR